MPNPDWRRSTRCSTGACPEVRDFGYGVAIRESADPDHAIVFDSDGWNEFLAAVKRGEFDRDMP